MPATAQPRPFAAVLLQLYTKRPQLAYNGAQRGTPAAARAELWRYALAEAVGTEGALVTLTITPTLTITQPLTLALTLTLTLALALALALAPTSTPTLSLTRRRAPSPSGK